LLLYLCISGGRISHAAEIEYPQIIKTRYEAADPKTGGQFVLWSERERIFYGLDPKLFPAAQYVEVLQVTPAKWPILLVGYSTSTTDPLKPAAFERYANGGDSAKLKDWASKNLPALQHIRRDGQNQSGLVKQSVAGPPQIRR
jgi:hypothetical protein